MRRIVLLLVGVPLLVYGVFDGCNVAIGDGHHPLKLHFPRNEGRDIVFIDYAIVADLSMAKLNIEDDQPWWDRPVAIESHDGVVSASIAVPVTSRRSMLRGRLLSYHQPKGLSLQITFADGTFVNRAFVIPDLRSTDSLEVPLTDRSPLKL